MRLIHNPYLNGILFSLYLVLMLEVFGASSFLSENGSKLDFYLILFITISGINVFFSVVLKSFINSFSLSRIIRVLIYLLSIIVSVYAVLPNYFIEENLIFIGFALLIASLLPIIMLLWDLYVQYLSSQLKLTIESLTQASDGNTESQTEMDEALTLRNKSGKVIFSSDFKCILFFEANDNYVYINYLSSDDTVKKHMERLSLKKIEALIDEYSKPFYRVHKSFIVNPEFLTEIKGRSQAYKLKLEKVEKPIPVSRNFDIDQLSGSLD